MTKVASVTTNVALAGITFGCQYLMCAFFRKNLKEIADPIACSYMKKAIVEYNKAPEK